MYYILQLLVGEVLVFNKMYCYVKKIMKINNKKIRIMNVIFLHKQVTETNILDKNASIINSY